MATPPTTSAQTLRKIAVSVIIVTTLTMYESSSTVTSCRILRCRFARIMAGERNPFRTTAIEETGKM